MAERGSSFLEGFSGHWRRSLAETEEAIKGYTVILDTNVLLDMYRMDHSARSDFFRVMEAVRGRLWIPRQVAKEFHKNRISALSSYIRNTQESVEEVWKASKNFKESLQKFANARSLRGERKKAFLEPLGRRIAEIAQKVEENLDSFDLTLEKVIDSDPVLEKLSSILDGCVGEGISEDEEGKVIQEAKRRVEQKIPPGYKDSGKEDQGVGDFIIWYEVLRYAEKTKKPILFVSNDAKEDWFYVKAGISIGPRPELVQEVYRRAGVDYQQILLPTFLARADSALDIRVSQNTIDQANSTVAQDVSSRAVDLLRRRAIARERNDLYMHMLETLRNEIEETKRNIDLACSRMSEAQDKIHYERAYLESGELSQTAVQMSRDRMKRLEMQVFHLQGEIGALEGELRHRLSDLEEIQRSVKQCHAEMASVDVELRSIGARSKDAGE